MNALPPRFAVRALALLGLLVSLPAAVSAATARLALERDAFLWNEEIVLRVVGFGCPDGVRPPEVVFDESAGRWVVYVDLLGCRTPPPHERFAYDVEIGRLYPREYEVRVEDAIRLSGARAGAGAIPGGRITPPPPAFDVRPITVHRAAQLAVEPAGANSDEAPARVAISGLASSSCFVLEGPFLEQGVHEFVFLDNCPILPAGVPNVFREERELGILASGRHEVRVLDVGEFTPDLPSDWTAPMARAEIEVHPAAGCLPDGATLCLAGRRFAATSTWEDHRGKTGIGRAVPLADRDASGLFWFFGPRNVEVTLKVLDGCRLNGHWWVFLSSGSDVAFRVQVEDTATGATWAHENPLGIAAPLVPDIRAFPCG